MSPAGDNNKLFSLCASFSYVCTCALLLFSAIGHCQHVAMSPVAMPHHHHHQLQHQPSMAHQGFIGSPGAAPVVGSGSPSSLTWQCKKTPTFMLPANKEVWELGRQAHWTELDMVLQPFAFGNFWVIDESQERILVHVRHRFDTSKYKGSQSILHTLVHVDGGDNPELFKQILALGVDPSQKTSLSWTPAHICGALGRIQSARALGPCRPDLFLKSQNNHHSALEAASGDRAYPGDATNDSLAKMRRMNRNQVHDLWLSYVNHGFPHVGQLAYEKAWWALQNLVRRRAVSVAELSEKFQGYTAVEWAEKHGQPCLAAELRYYYFPEQLGVASVPVPHVVQRKQQIKAASMPLAGVSFPAAAGARAQIHIGSNLLPPAGAFRMQPPAMVKLSGSSTMLIVENHQKSPFGSMSHASPWFGSSGDNGGGKSLDPRLSYIQNMAERYAELMERKVTKLPPTAFGRANVGQFMQAQSQNSYDEAAEVMAKIQEAVSDLQGSMAAGGGAIWKVVEEYENNIKKQQNALSAILEVLKNMKIPDNILRSVSAAKAAAAHRALSQGLAGPEEEQPAAMAMTPQKPIQHHQEPLPIPMTMAAGTSMSGMPVKSLAPASMMTHREMMRVPTTFKLGAAAGNGMQTGPQMPGMVSFEHPAARAPSSGLMAESDGDLPLAAAVAQHVAAQPPDTFIATAQATDGQDYYQEVLTEEG